jgi:long-chain acyl-CoA synthetase
VNVVSLLDQRARNAPHAPAVLNEHRLLTYGDLATATSQFGAGLLERGVVPNDRVGIVQGNTPAFLVAFLGTLRIGAIAVPLNTRLRDDEFAPLLTEVGARVAVAPERLHSHLSEVDVIGAESVDDDLSHIQSSAFVRCAQKQWGDVSNILFTSGSTSRPKGVMQTHGLHMANGAALSDFFQLNSSDVTALISPMFHIAGLTMLSAALHLGCGFTLHSRWDPEEALAAMDAYGVSFVHLVGTVFLDIVRAEQTNRSDRTFGRLRHVMSGGAAIDEVTLRWFEDRFGCTVGGAYGRTEGGKTWSEPDSPSRWYGHGTVNRNVCELRIVNPETGQEVERGTSGEIRVRGDGISLGYWGRPEFTAAAFDDAGWMCTGDTGRVDADEVLHFEGRTDGLIKSGGENVSPVEVEQVLVQIKGIAEAVVTSVPDARLGETVGAVLVCSQPLTAEEIQKESREHLAGFKIPRVVRIVDQIPRLGSQKVDVPAVKRLLQERT